MKTLQINKFSNVLFSFTFFFLFIVNVVQLSAQVSSYEWRSLKIGGGGYVTGVVIHPRDKDIMYVRTDVGGAYRWDVKAEQWEQMLNWVGPDNANLIGVDGIAVDPNLPDRIYLALGKRINGEGGVFRSDDRGETWAKLMTAAFESNGRAARWVGECLAADPNSSSVIYAGTRLATSSDFGETWTDRTLPDVARLFSWGAPSPESAYPTAYCYGTLGDKWGLYRSIDMGANWVRINDDKNQFPAGVKAIAADRKVFGRIYVGSGGSGIYYGEPAKGSPSFHTPPLVVAGSLRSIMKEPGTTSFMITNF